MKLKNLFAAFLAGAALLSSVSCSASIADKGSVSSATSSAHRAYLQEMLPVMPDSLTLAVGAEAEAIGMDTSNFVDSEGFYIRAVDGEVVIVSPSDAGMDRAVRHFATKGNIHSYTYTYGEDYRVGNITVGGNSISEYAVVYPDDVGYTDIISATGHLEKYIRRACGVSLPIYSASEYAADTEAPRRVITFAVDYETHGDEGFTIEVKENGDISILGGRYRGFVYGVFDLLEDIGWRFVGFEGYNYPASTTDEYLYESETVELTSAINRTELPSIPVRCISTPLYYGNAHFYRVNEGGYGTVQKSCHGLHNNSWIFNGIYDFSSVGHQPCFTDEEILIRIENFVRDKVTAAGEAGTIGRSFTNVDVAQYDSAAFCNCEQCQEVYNYDGVSGAVLQMTNRMADAAAEEAAKYSDETVYVTMLAYHGTNNPPSVTVPRDNVKISYCFYCGNSQMSCTNHCISGENCTSSNANFVYDREFERWCEISAPGAMQVWYYPMNCYHVGYMNPHNDVIYEDLQYLVEHDIDCIMFCAGGDYNGIQLTLGLELCWNSDMTLEEYNERTREYFNICYGSAGDVVYEVNNMLIAAGDATECFTGFHSDIQAKISDQYFNIRFEDMYTMLHQELLTAETSTIEMRIEFYLARILYGYLYINHENMYTNGTEEMRSEYFELYSEMHALFRKYNLYTYDDYMTRAYIPEECDPTVFPY